VNQGRRVKGHTNNNVFWCSRQTVAFLRLSAEPKPAQCGIIPAAMRARTRPMTRLILVLAIVSAVASCAARRDLRWIKAGNWTTTDFARDRYECERENRTRQVASGYSGNGYSYGASQMQVDQGGFFSCMQAHGYSLVDISEAQARCSITSDGMRHCR
jgi:hypothetical protein